MCDYSLHLVTSRPAKVGDKLVSTVEFTNPVGLGIHGWFLIGCRADGWPQFTDARPTAGAGGFWELRWVGESRVRAVVQGAPGNLEL
jgi:hypothetical protein